MPDALLGTLPLPNFRSIKAHRLIGLKDGALDWPGLVLRPPSCRSKGPSDVTYLRRLLIMLLCLGVGSAPAGIAYARPAESGKTVTAPHHALHHAAHMDSMASGSADVSDIGAKMHGKKCQHDGSACSGLCLAKCFQLLAVISLEDRRLVPLIAPEPERDRAMPEALTIRPAPPPPRA